MNSRWTQISGARRHGE